MRIYLLVILVVVFLFQYAQTQVIELNGNNLGRTFYGIGGLSGGGGTSRLLFDYEELYQSQILDYLFKPNFGASLQILKVEIGGDCDSTDGSEASHMHTPTDENYQRGYEWWLMEEAVKRNPNIVLYALVWCMPYWVGNGTYYTQDSIDYIIKWIDGAKQYHNLSISYVGIWNEKPFNVDWIKQFRKSLDSEGLDKLQIVAADDCCADRWTIVDSIVSDSDLANAIAVVGAHVASTYNSTAAAQQLKQPLWSTEAHFVNGEGIAPCWAQTINQFVNGEGIAPCWAQTINQDYVTGLMTANIAWYLIDSFYPSFSFSNMGFMNAYNPWSGNYDVQPNIWVNAHTTQFTEIGWIYLAHGSGTGMLSMGSYVTLVPPSNSGDFSIIIETVVGNQSTSCATVLTENENIKLSQNITFSIGPGLHQNVPLFVRYTQFFSEDTYFTALPQITPSGGQFTISLSPNALYTISTLSTSQKGAYPSPPPASDFPMPYKDNFESYSVNGTYAKYFSDVTGIFEIYKNASAENSNQVLRQSVPYAPYGWCDNTNPVTVIGIVKGDYSISVDVLLEGQEGFVAIGGRVVVANPCNGVPQSGYWFTLYANGTWTIFSGSQKLQQGSSNFMSNSWSSVALEISGITISGYIGNTKLFTVSNSAYGDGFAALGTGWNYAQFDNFSLGN